EDDVLGYRLAVHDAGRAFIPVFTFFPGCPTSLGIKTMQLVRAAAYIRIKGELNRIILLLKDVLGEDSGAAPTVEEGGVEARIGLLQREFDSVIIQRSHSFDIIHKEAVGIETLVIDQAFDCEDHIGGSKGLTV